MDARVLAGHTNDILDRLPLTGGPRQVVDLAAGTGAGTFARFPDVHVTAVDASPGHLRRFAEKARARNVDAHVRTVLADLDDDPWPDLGTPDLVWASGSVHHLADPDRTLRGVHDLLSPGGLFVVVEMAALPRFLFQTAPAERPGLEGRVHAVSDRHHARHLPHRGADWGPMLTAAAFTVERERVTDVEVKTTGDDAVGQYALGALQRVRGAVAADLAVRTKRSIWAARRT